MSAVIENSSPLVYKVVGKCSTSKARAGILTLRHGEVLTPVFMPVGSQGTLKGILPSQLLELNCKIMLSNTYHLGMRPGIPILKKAGGLHKFMGWPGGILTDSGGFQIVSLSQLCVLDENGVEFVSPYDGSQSTLTPERSVEIQNAIGADIMMQLDDVVKTTTTGPRVAEAMHRSVRWLDRALGAHTRNDDQSVFPIIQGGLEPELRQQCVAEMIKRPVRGVAVGGLSGGESKAKFWRTVHVTTDCLPTEKPRYLMGVGYTVDLIVCTALGIDMFDCVFPTRTGRFGSALVADGQLNLKKQEYAEDLRPIDEQCACRACQLYTRSYLHHTITEPVTASLISIHNVAYQLNLMRTMRDSILRDDFPACVRSLLKVYYGGQPVPEWVSDALLAVNIQLHDA